MSKENRGLLARSVSVVLVAFLALWALLAALVLLVMSGLLDRWERTGDQDLPEQPDLPGFRARRARLVQPDRGVPLARQEYPEWWANKDRAGSEDRAVSRALPEHLAIRVQRGDVVPLEQQVRRVPKAQ